MTVKFTNNASGTLAASIGNNPATDTTITVSGSQGALFPILVAGSGDYFYATLVDPANNIEIVKVTARVADVMTVVRGQDGTVPRTYNAGDRLELRPVAAALNALITYTPAGNISATTVQGAISELDTEKAGLALNNTLSGNNTFSGNNSFSGTNTFTGINNVPTAALGTDTTQVASTAFVQDAVDARVPSGVLTVDNTNNRVGINQVTPTVTLHTVGTDAVILPVGTTVQRPATPAVGMFRMNSTTGNPEWYDTVNSVWVEFSNLSKTYWVEYLIVGGGGAGGAYAFGGGGGGGGVVAGMFQVKSGIQYFAIVGAGGAGGSGSYNNGRNGDPSIFANMVAAGGGGGGSFDSSTFYIGLDGGCGGGNSGYGSPGNARTSVGRGMQGFHGALGGTYGGGGGGGAGESGSPGGGLLGGDGGDGRVSTITGSSVYYAGGGGGGGYNGGAGGNGGLGGGGAGATANTNNAVSGASNTGGGGGGVSSIAGGLSGAGGSGIIILRYSGAQRGSGGTVSSVGGNTLHTFTTVGSNTFTA
jgi:hypothetical protein